MHVTITPNHLELSPGAEIVLRNQTWTDYEALLDRRQDNAGVKVLFDGDLQEIRLMAPMPGHGKRSDILARLVTALLDFQDIDWEGFHPITLKEFKKKGLEPDYCLYIANRPAILGKERIDLAVDPPPDLALEVDLTSFTSPDDYEDIRVPELWIYRRKSLSIYLFDGQHYQESDASPTFPGVPTTHLMSQFIERGWAVGSSVALREFRAVLQEGVPFL